MTVFAGIVGNGLLSDRQYSRYELLVQKLQGQAEGFSKDSFRRTSVAATKLYLPHSRTLAMAKDNKTESLLACIGNPFRENLSAVSQKDCAAKLLDEYLKKGRSAITSLSAPFVVIIYDGRDKSFSIVTDRAGIGHIYIAQTEGCYLISTSSLALASAMGVHLNSQAVADYFLVGHLLGRETFYREIEKVDSATWLKIVDGRREETKYWQPPDEREGKADIHNSGDELANTLKKAVSGRLWPDGRVSIEITGGIDSRMNLACAAVSGKDFLGWTIGRNGCAELQIIELLKQKQAFRHYAVEPVLNGPAAFLSDLQLINTLTDGEVNSLNLIASPSCNRQTSQLRDASISGVGGEILRGFYYVSHKGLSNNSKQIKTGRLISLKLRPNIGTRTELFSDVFPFDYSNILVKSVEDCLAETEGKPLFWRLDEFYLRGRMQRFGGRSCVFNSYFYRQELPFFDNDVLDLAFSLPWRFKEDSRVIKYAMAACHRGFSDVALMNGLPARPLSYRDLAAVLRYYKGYSAKVVKKAKSILGGATTSADDTGINSIVGRNLCSPEVAELMSPEKMASGFLYKPEKLREFVRFNRENGFKDRVQTGLILSFELACKYLGSALKV